MKKSSIDNLNLGVSPDQAQAITDVFFEQFEPKITKGKSWTFHRFCAACDTPDAETVQAVLYHDNERRLVLYARQGRTQHAVTYNRRPVRFRTFDDASAVLNDVAHLDTEVITDLSGWKREVGPI